LIFMSSQLLPEGSDVCDEVAMIDNGKHLVYDTLANVTNRFSGDGNSNVVEVGFGRALDDAIVTGQIAALPGVISVERMDSRNVRIKFSGGTEFQERIFTDLDAMHIGVISFRASGSALEDSYLNLIKDTL